MRKMRWIILVLSLSSAVAGADVVYLRNGKKYEGKITRRGDKITVKMAFATMTFDANEVIHVEKKAVPDRPKDPKPGPDHLPAPRREFTIADATRPEPIAFVFMRSLMVAASGPDSDDLRQQIDRWQIAAHDHKRKAGAKWLSPADYVRRRKAYLGYLEEARKYLRKTWRPGSSKPETLQQRRNRTAAMSRLYTAAKTWADPSLRVFLLGVVAYHRRQWAAAEEYFASCTRALPRVAMFHQARGMALSAGDSPVEAMDELATVLRLKPGDRDAIRMLKRAMAKVPGKDTRSKAYLDAEKLLSVYDLKRVGRPTSSRGIKWLAPGKAWTVRDKTLPVPTMDRLTFRQAVAVPVGPQALLVDADAVADALAVHVRIDENTLVVGKTKSVTGSGAGTTRKLALVTVSGIEFTPVEADIDKAKAKAKDPNAPPDKPPLAKGQAVTVYGLGVYEQMGSLVRKVPATIKKVAEDGTVARISACLLPGEAAGPILTDDNRLVGFLAPRTTVKVHNGGPDRLIPLSRIAQLIKRGQRSSSSARYLRKDAKAAPAPAGGSFFIVYVTFGEKFEQ